MSTASQIIVIKRKSGHGGRHGGAWKVAYADFVTAMMALFIVLWLMNSSKQIQVAVGGYFKDPTGTAKMVGTNQTGSGENFTLVLKNSALRRVFFCSREFLPMRSSFSLVGCYALAISGPGFVRRNRTSRFRFCATAAR
jgi:Membrane MotB of proton-channel complex MotA/MotB